MKPDITILDSCTSTNSVLNGLTDAADCTVIATHTQTAGRGQRGNSWEAEPGKNLTFSMLFRPTSLEAARQFELSMIVSLAIADAIDSRLPEGIRTTIKWPNDIYIGLEKVCGILIENKLAGRNIERAIAGVGINVNQTEFLSDAPNPTSIILHNGGATTDLTQFLTDVTSRMADYAARYFASPNPAALKSEYMSRLMWTDGTNPFRDADGTFTARITDVALDGILTLSNGRQYAFKEVAYII
ncbi:MAG: biotin--[acetyl-CoA-carboxylase] ligase [Bacteroidales bacterium]|nr:biotin--[acetyl-CoA-carboxylase] ligase [Bacteroidales bacterium]